MTTYSRGSPYGRKASTVFHLIYRIENGELQSVGLFETRERAEEDLALLNPPGRRPGDWKIADLHCLGWGVVDNVVSRNAPIEPLSSEEWLKLSEPEDESLWTDTQRDA